MKGAEEDAQMPPPTITTRTRRCGAEERRPILLELMRRGEVVGRAVLAGLRVHLCREPAVRVGEAAQRLWRAVWRAESDLRARSPRRPAAGVPMAPSSRSSSPFDGPGRPAPASRGPTLRRRDDQRARACERKSRRGTVRAPTDERLARASLDGATLELCHRLAE